MVFPPAPLPDFAPIIINYRLLVRLGETGGSCFHHTHGETPPTYPYPKSGVDPPPNLTLCMYLTPHLYTLALYLTLLTSTESRHILRQQHNQTRPTVNSKQNSNPRTQSVNPRNQLQSSAWALSYLPTPTPPRESVLATFRSVSADVRMYLV